MRKKLDANEKRSNYIGIKVQSETRKQLNFIASREVTPLSTLINTILKEYINNYINIAKINWEQLSPEEKETEK